MGFSKPQLVDLRDAACVTGWAECISGEYNPLCCRFPKSCSAGTLVIVPKDAAVRVHAAPSGWEWTCADRTHPWHVLIPTGGRFADEERCIADAAKHWALYHMREEGPILCGMQLPGRRVLTCNAPAGHGRLWMAEQHGALDFTHVHVTSNLRVLWGLTGAVAGA